MFAHFAHISLGVKDLSKAIAFYDAVLGTLDYPRLFGSMEEEFMAYGLEDSFFLVCTPLDSEAGKVQPCNGTHICFKAKSKEAVDAFYKTAIENGATCAGKPGIREMYAPDYYAAYVLDLDGHKIEALNINR